MIVLAHAGLPCELHDPGFWALMFGSLSGAVVFIKVGWGRVRARFGRKS